MVVLSLSLLKTVCSYLAAGFCRFKTKYSTHCLHCTVQQQLEGIPPWLVSPRHNDHVTSFGTMCCRLMDGFQKSQQASMRHPQRPCFLEGKMPCRGKAWSPCTGSCKPDRQAGTPRGTTPRCWRLPVALADLPLLSRYYILQTSPFKPSRHPSESDVGRCSDYAAAGYTP